MIRKKFKLKVGEMPLFVLVHFKNASGVYDFKLTATENAYIVKKELVESGMAEVTIPILEYRAKQLIENGGVFK